MVHYDLDELKKMKITGLKKIAKELDIPGRSKYRSATKHRLAEKIYNQQKIKRRKQKRSREKKNGKFTRTELERKKVAELKKLAKQEGIKKYYKLKKSQLVTALLGEKIEIEIPTRKRRKPTRRRVKRRPSRRRVRVPPSPVEKGARAQFLKLTKKQLLSKLKDTGITGVSGKNKSELVEYLLAARCYPDRNVLCEDDLICDVDKNICMSQDRLGKQQQQRIAGKSKIYTLQIQGKTIVGSKAAIKTLRDKISEEEVKVPEEEVPFEEEEVPFEEDDERGRQAYLDFLKEREEEEEVKVPEEEVGIVEPVDILAKLRGEEPVSEEELVSEEEPEKISREDVEKVLEEIQEEPVTDLREMRDVQRQVLRCLGLET